MDYPILSYHSHSFLEQLRRHFQNLDTFLNEILPIDIFLMNMIIDLFMMVLRIC